MRLILTSHILSVLCVCTSVASLQETVSVITKQGGEIVGHLDAAHNGLKYVRFIGVPFAKPPVGELRFEEPEMIDSWPGTWIANRSTKCLQVSREGNALEGTEDCLYLNIFVPGTTVETNSLDVLVRIHGEGGFMYGGSNENNGGEKLLMPENVIVVTVNYRLGIFGFLSSEDSSMPGNNGLKDQTVALRWIKDNIDTFGGNPHSITIVGHSAGGASVHFHQLSPYSTGLFHKAVSYSGVSLNPWALQDKALAKFQMVASYTGCINNDCKNNEDVKKCLKTRNAYQILDATNLFRKFHFNPFAPFGPVFDHWASRPFLPRHPFDALRNRELVNHVPWITSMTSAEGLYPGAEYAANDFQLLGELNEKWTEVIEHVLHYEETSHPLMRKTIAKAIREKYFGKKNLTEKYFKKLIKLLSDRLFLSDFDTAIRLQAYASDQPVYVYHYNYSAAEAFSLAFGLQGNKKRYGVAHGDDVFLTMGLEDPQTGQLSRNPQDLKMTKFLINMLVTFAKTGRPGIEPWQPMTRPDEIKFLSVETADDVRMQTVPEFGRSEYWRRMIFEENEFHDMGLQEIDPELPSLFESPGKTRNISKDEL